MAGLDKRVVSLNVCRQWVQCAVVGHHPLVDLQGMLQGPPPKAGLDEAVEGLSVRWDVRLQSEVGAGTMWDMGAESGK